MGFGSLLQTEKGYVTPNMCLHSQTIHKIIMTVMIGILSKQYWYK